MEKIKLYNFHDNFIFRTPLLPVQKEAAGLEALFKYSQDEFFKEAIYLASPILYDELVKWHNGELKIEKEINKLVYSLFKYYTRMQNRCTPYGLFAGCATGTWSDKNEIILNQSLKRHTRLDMNYLCALVQQLNRNAEIFPLLRFYPNNSLYTSGETLRYVEYQYVGGKRVHQISAVDQSEYLLSVLSSAENGAYIRDLAACLITDEISIEEADTFVQELITSQILVSEIEPAITGDEFIHQVLRTLRKINIHDHPEITSVITLLEGAQQNIEAIDQNIQNGASAYRAIRNDLKKLKTPFLENQLFQTDLFKCVTIATLGAEIQEQLLQTIMFLNKFSKKDEKPRLAKFIEDFRAKYEDAEMPILEVLDTETGIGYAARDTAGINILIDDISGAGNNRHSYEINWSKQQEFLHNKLSEADKTNAYTVIFTDNDLKEMDFTTAALPDSISIMFEAYDNDKIYMHSFGSSSAACLLGRFAHGDKTIHKIVNDITAHEQMLEKERVLAEIIHLPESRIGNILLRPALRNYEIPYLGKSALPQENQLPLQDLMVSVRHNRIILRSKKLNREIIPRLSTAHNYAFNALPVYHFLCELQHQYPEKMGLTFNWGALSGNYKFLPRAQYKDVVISLAKWQFQKQDLQSLLDDRKSNYDEALTAWREKWNVPQRVLLEDGDNKLLVNFCDPLSVKMLLSLIKKRDRVAFQEHLYDHDNMMVKDSEGNSYTNECIAILMKNKDVETKTPVMLKNNSPGLLQRNFPIGSSWLYYKLYCGVKTADKLLSEILKPVTEKIIENNWADKFFFIRYTDPEHHIRLRFHIDRDVHLGDVISLIGQAINPYLDNGMISKIQTDTYKRELERYGENTMELAESLFFADSVSTLQFLDLTEGLEGEDLRWQFALRSIDELLDSFGYGKDKKLRLLEYLKESFIKEHGAGKRLKLQLDTKFRNMRKQVDDIMNRHNDPQREIGPIIELLKWKKEQIAPIASQIISFTNKGELKLALDDLLGSYIHMMMNRLFKARQRTYEMVLYDLLYKHLKSLAGREKFVAKNALSKEEV